ncbi:unnamed protein product [Cylicocyclus nassatus]|uniref:DUF5641 domain-containing protein n=1 Tax=Cylicocyclus nassatus TaxID=53992 RepID=A0AA36GFR7_CYLNA|nr:unnamed protein product [Cylicocyclus nassatus]
MSIFGAHKARITKAANAIRKKIAEFDEAILEPLDFTIEAGRDPQLVLSRKSLLFFHFTSFGRTVDSLRAQREKAEEFARQHPDENGEFPLLQQIQDHWDTSGLDDLVEEAETLRDRVDAAIKLLPSSEALYYFRTSTVPPSLVNPTPNPTRDPIYPQQLAPDVRMEIASHSSSHDRDRPADPEAVVPARPAPPPACAPSVAQGFDNPSHDPSAHPTFVNPPPVHQSNPFSSFLVPNVNSSPSSVEQTLKLPTFEIPTFHGDIDNFLEFWDLFSVAVHNNINVPASMKFMYLKSHLRGPAASIIAGFQSTAENYEDAVRTLTNTYGRPEILRNRLWDKLMQLPPASDSPMSQRATYCTVKAIWTQLTHLKEDSSAIGTLKIIRAKFPRRTREKIGEYKTKGDAMWTVDELLSTLDTIIDRLETIEDADSSEHLAYNSQASVRHDSSLPRRYPSVSRTDSAFTRYRTSSYYPRRPSVSRTPSPYSRHNRPPTPYYPRNASRSPSRPRYAISYEPYCAFCRDPGHPSERCNIVRDVAQRRSILVRYRLCWLCLQRGHGYAQCDAPLCEYCGRIHHRALCWNPPRARTPPPPANGNTRRSLDRFYSPRRVQFYRETQGSVPRAYRGYSRASSSRNAYPKPPSPSRRQPSTSPARRASSARRSRSISAVHSATGTPDQPVASVDEQAEPLDHHRIRVGSHSPSSCISVCSQESAQPRLMVVHTVTKNYKTDTDELLTVFLDSGSQFSFICTSLAKHLGLSFRNTRTFTTLTFGGHQFTEESSEVTLILWDQYNYPIYLDLWTRERITTVPRTNTQNDKDIVDLGDRVEVDVLIGIDNYWRIVDLHRNEKLPSGLILSHTRFGPVLSGQKHPLATNTLLATKTPLDDDEVATHQLIKSLFGLDLVATEEEENTEDANTIKHFYDTQDPANRLKEEILANTYVDNVIVGAKTTQECVDKCKECKDIFSRMHMNLREFMSNNQRAMASIPQDSCMLAQGQYVGLLGVRWNPTLDTLHVPLNIARQAVTSKRTALQVYASTFDPLGLLAPLLIKAKMFIQDLWELGYGWDDSLTDEDIQKWNAIVQDISSFQLSVPRYIGDTFEDTYDLVVCSDASKRVYATAIYILTRPRRGTPRSTLLFAKAKLAPPGAITIPRMELLASHMAAKTVQFLRAQLKVRFCSIKFLTDSQIVLYWIHSQRPLKTYVVNRVKYIRRVLDELETEKIATGFYYLATQTNPADCATRGVTASELQHHIWWTGPTFFATPFSQWPCKSFQPSQPIPPGAESEELRIPETVVNSVSGTQEAYTSFVPFTRTNSYVKLVRITAYILKYVTKLRHRVRTRNQREDQEECFPFNTMNITPTITSDDFMAAELVLIREHYRESQRQMNGTYVKKLHTKRETDGTIRVDMRMVNAQMSDTMNSVNPNANAVIRPIDLISPNFKIARLRDTLPRRIAHSTSDSYQTLNTRYRILQSDLDCFWNLWQQEYLRALADREAIRAKSRPSAKSPRVGEVVLVKQDAPRSSWPLGLILELHTSPDGNVRSAKIRTGRRKVVDRAVNHLLPLEIIAEDEEVVERSGNSRAKAQQQHRGLSRK